MLKKLFGGLLGGRKQPDLETLTFEQRRKTARRPCSFEVECRIGRADVQAEVVDLSVSGLRIHLPQPMKLKPKSVLKVTLPDPDGKIKVQTVECLTKWTRVRDSDGTLFAGAEFKDPKGLGRSWVKAKMQELGFRPYNIKEQRNDYRAPCNLKASVDLGGTVLPCRVKNIGLGGMFIKLTKPIRAGAAVEVKVFDNTGFPTDMFSATVRHQQHPEPTSPWGYGLAFKAISLQQADTIRDFMQERQKEEWESVDGDSGSEDYAIFAEAAAESDEGRPDLEGVEIPSLDSIMEETEPEEEEDEETEAQESEEDET
jgi:hypothetical protein